MKKIFIAATLIAALTTSAIASPRTDAKALKHLTSQFKDATNISWKTTDNYTKATFNWNSQVIEVFYNNDGEHIATGRHISEDALPLNALKVINDKYKDYKPSEAIEMDNVESGTDYYVSLVKDQEKVILQVSPSGSVSVFKK